MNVFTRTVLIAGLCAASLNCFAQGTSSSKPATAAKSTSGSSSLPSEATVDSFLKKMFGWNQELSWKVAEIKQSEAAGITEATVVFSTPKGQQVTRIYVTPDQKFAFTGDLVPFGADPFAEAREDLKDVKGPVHGSADAPVTIVEFGDLECPACKAAQSNVEQLLKEEPKVKLIFENFPLTQHPWAMLGAKYVDCLGRAGGDTVWKFISTVYTNQEQVTQQNAEEKLKGYVKDSGGDPDKVAACAATPETEKRVKESMDLGQKLDVSSTPTFFINGRRVVGFNNPSVPYDAVKSMVDFELTNAK
jgi:protein-disulfide isomerase